MENSSYLRYCVYYYGVFDDQFAKLPGIRLLDSSCIPESEESSVRRKVEQSCRKLLLMWTAGTLALDAEQTFYSTTVRESPALYGEHAVLVQYHLEAMIFFARSALDIASGAFGKLLPPPFPQRRFDSFNSLLKAISKLDEAYSFYPVVQQWRTEERGWLRLVAEVERGRSLRDQLAHQIGFPISYRELTQGSEKESPVVDLSEELSIPLAELVDTLRSGVVNAFLELENCCLADCCP